MSILIVDDSQVLRSLLTAMLQAVGHDDVLCASSASEAFTYLGIGVTDQAAPKASIDLILMDIMMPEVDGIVATRIIKKVAELRDIPILIVTARSKNDNLAMAFEAGAVDYITKPLDEVELPARVSAALRLKREIDERKAREKELLRMQEELEAKNLLLKQLSLTDSLTGAANRRHFDEVLKIEVARTERSSESLALILVDIDHFKRYNDQHGHQQGDACLARVAVALRKVLKRPCDLLARYGGEEFVAVLPTTDLHGAMAVAETMRAAIEALPLGQLDAGMVGRVTISLGVAAMQSGSSTPEALLAEADRALYRAKEAGRNVVRADRPAQPTKALPAL